MGNTASDILGTEPITQDSLLEAINVTKNEINTLIADSISDAKTEINKTIQTNSTNIDDNEQGDTTFRQNFALSSDLS